MSCHRLFLHRIGALLALGLLAGCAFCPHSRLTTEQGTSITEDAPSTFMMQAARYTLIELRPDPGQQDLQQQIIDLTIPATAATTVGDAIRYVLRHSGYQLCEGDPALAILWTLTLPAAHLQLGPLPLNQTLQLLAGSAWRLSVDEHTRQVCFFAVPLAGGLNHDANTPH